MTNQYYEDLNLSFNLVQIALISKLDEEQEEDTMTRNEVLDIEVDLRDKLIKLISIKNKKVKKSKES